FRVQKELLKAKEEAERESLNKSKKWIDEKKYYNDLSLTQELKSWERVQAKFKAGTEERKEADREVYRLKNEINKQLIQMNDEYTARVKAANKELLESEKRLNEEYGNKISETNKRLLDNELRLKEDYEKSVKEVNDRLISEENRL